MADYKKDIKYFREQLKLEKDTLVQYDILGMDKDCEQYQFTVNEIARLENKLNKVNKFYSDEEELIEELNYE